MLSRFLVLRRRLARIVEQAPDVSAASVDALLEDIERYLGSPREPALAGELTDFFVATVFRGAASELLAKAGDAPWRGALEAFEARRPREEVLSNGGRFSTDFVSANAPVWTAALHELVGRPGARGLEVGSFEGRSCIWFLDNVLTEPSSTMTCVDTFDAADQGLVDSGIVIDKTQLRSRFDHNLAASGHSDRVTKLSGRSQHILRGLALDSYDFAYIDGSHRTSDVLEDVVQTWPLLRAGGVLVLDDYGYRANRNTGADVAPDLAMDAFLACFAGQWREIHRGYQLLVQKIARASSAT